VERVMENEKQASFIRKRFFFYLLFLLLILLALVMLRPFFTTIIISLISVILLKPVYDFFLGFGDIRPTSPLRLFTAIEAITGLVLIAWTAFAVFLAMRQYWREDREVKWLCWNCLDNEPLPMESRALK
jgi:predicted PurR-regulated permease PerM